MVLLILQSPRYFMERKEALKTFLRMQSAFLDAEPRDLYTWNEASYYVLGMEDGAYAANVFTMMLQQHSCRVSAARGFFRLGGVS